jgi:hypothetical protein
MVSAANIFAGLIMNYTFNWRILKKFERWGVKKFFKKQTWVISGVI